jgi:hypothetical protein
MNSNAVSSSEYPALRSFLILTTSNQYENRRSQVHGSDVPQREGRLGFFLDRVEEIDRNIERFNAQLEKIRSKMVRASKTKSLTSEQCAT